MTNKFDISLLHVMHLRGPNIWTYRPVIEAWVDIGLLEDYPSNRIPGLYERLCAWLPSLEEHHCGVGERGGFLQRLRTGTWAGHILEHVVLELQSLAGMYTGFGKAREAGPRGVYKVVFRTLDEAVGRAALAAGRELLLAAINDTPCDVQALIAEIKDMVDRRCLGPSTASIVDAAAEKKVPHIRLNDGNLVQLGYGARQHRIWTAETDRTSAIAEGVASNKALTKSLLQSCGIPIPEGRVVDSPEDAWEAAQEIGLPVVVKPVDANHGRGVGLDLNTRAEVMNAYPLALENGSEVMVEQFIRGNEHRLLVVGQRMVAAASGESAWISGDGEHSVLELIDSQINSDPRRGFEEEFPLNWLNLQEHPEIRLVLERQGLTPESIPEPGRRVLIQHNGNVAFDVTDSVHPEVARLACLAARVVGLDVAGIDLVAQDISQPLQSQRGAIIEVNAGPGLLAHLKPASGQPRPVGMAILEHLIGTGQDGRIPVVGVLGDRDATLVAHLIAWFLQAAKQRVGLACADGLYLDSRMIASGDSTGYEAGERLLINRNVNAAVLEASCRSILSEGLAYDRCAVGVVTGMPAADDLAEFYIRDQDQVFNIVRTQVDVVLPGGVTVLSASLPCVEELAQLSDGEVLLYGQDVAHEAIAAQRRSGGRAVFLRQSTIVLAKGTEEIILFELAALRLARPAAPETILAAVAAGWALGITPALLVAALRSFNPEAETADV